MKEYSKTFCVYPWLHQMTTPTGKINFCCISEKTHVVDDKGQPFQLGKDKFQDAWNSSYMKNIRREMIQGKPVYGCEVCYQQEQVGKKSYRQMHNDEWSSKLGSSEIKKRVTYSINNDFEVNLPPTYLDLRLGNVCNLKCRMCNPYNSVLIHKEWLELDKQSESEYSNFWSKYGLKNGTSEKWYESDVFWKNVEEFIPHLKKVYMTGGEPTLIESNYKFLDRCKELGYDKNIELFFNLNFTNLKRKFIDQLGSFKWVSINASIDGYKEVNDYIRTGSQWANCEKNLRELLVYGDRNIGLGISPVIQVYNILDLNKLLDFCEELILEYDRDILIDFLFCFNPEFLDFSILPDSIKEEASDRLKVWSKKSKTLNRFASRAGFLRNGIQSLLNRLEQTKGEESSEKIKDFLNYTQTLDKQRNQDFTKTFPDLSEMLSIAGYRYGQ